MANNEPPLGWVWRKLDAAMRKMIVGPQFLKQLQNHSGVELQDVKRTYSLGTSNFIEMKNGDTYSISVFIKKQKAVNE